MIGICPHCGNYKRDKEVTEAFISCPECGHQRPYRRLPLLILTGCSGVGKTTTGLALQQISDLPVLDSDFFQPLKTEEDYQKQVERMERLSANIMQCGKPVLWTKAGNLNMLQKAWHSRFFSGIHCLALTCEEGELRRRMKEGRKITDEGWIQSSVDYNRYFETHTAIDGLPFDTLDITLKTPEEAAEEVLRWCRKFTPYSMKKDGCF